MKNIRSIPFIWGLIILFSFYSCGEGKKEDDSAIQDLEVENEKNQEKETTRKKIQKARKILEKIPTPIESARLFQKNGVKFHKELLNPPENYKDYTSSEKQALGMGIYGSDLSYSAVFDETSEVLRYLSSVQHLAENLDLKSAVDRELVERINENVDNRDSLLPLVSKLFEDLEEYLQSNEREKVLALSAAAGWIEGAYLVMSSLDDKDPDPELVNRLIEQKFVVEDLIEMIGLYSSTPSIKRVRKDLKRVQKEFQRVKVITKAEDEDVYKYRLEVDITDEQFQNLITVIGDVRSSYVKTGS